MSPMSGHQSNYQYRHHVRPLGVLSFDLSLDRPGHIVSATSFYCMVTAAVGCGVPPGVLVTGLDTDSAVTIR